MTAPTPQRLHLALYRPQGDCTLTAPSHIHHTLTTVSTLHPCTTSTDCPGRTETPNVRSCPANSIRLGSVQPQHACHCTEAITSAGKTAFNGGRRKATSNTIRCQPTTLQLRTTQPRPRSSSSSAIATQAAPIANACRHNVRRRHLQTFKSTWLS